MELNSVIADLQAKRAELMRQFEALDKGIEITSLMIKTLEQGLSELQGEARATCISSLLRLLQQEAKLSGLQVAIETTSANVNGNGSKPASDKGKTRRATVELITPTEFKTFGQLNNRLGVEGDISGLDVRYKRVFVGIDGVRTTEVCPGSAKAWREYIQKNMSVESVIAGDKWPTCDLEGNYVLELKGVQLKDLSKLLDYDFSQSPESDHNQTQMERDGRNLQLMETEEETELEPEAPLIQEEIRETEPVTEVDSPKDPEGGYHPVGLRFQLIGVRGYEGERGTIAAVTPGVLQPYEAQMDAGSAFQFNPMLTHAQVQPLTVEQAQSETEEDEIDIEDLAF